MQIATHDPSMVVTKCGVLLANNAAGYKKCTLFSSMPATT